VKALIGAGLLLLAPSLEPAPRAVDRRIVAPGSGRMVLTLDRDVYERARADLGDLRVREGETEIPYLLEHVSEEVPRPVQHPQIHNRVFRRGEEAQATLDFGAPTLKSQLTLSLSGDNFRRRVKVEGRGARDTEWSTLTDSAYVFAVPGPSPARYETVALPDNNFQVLRVTVFNGPDDPARIEIHDASARPAPRRRSREVPLAARLARREDASARETILTLDLGARHQPFRAVHLDVSDPAFFRGVVVEARVDPVPTAAGMDGAALAWTYLGESAVYRYAEGDLTRESVRLDVSGRERVLRLRIRNRDDRPLEIQGVTVMVPVERLAFDARPGASYRLRDGDQRLAAPTYDLARTAGDPALFAARATEAALTAPETVPVPAAAPPPWTERNPAAVWAALIAVVTGLGAVTWRALRTAG
jgi:hypothetical protein